MNERRSLFERTPEEGGACPAKARKACAWHAALLRFAIALSALLAPGAVASDSVLVNLRVTVVPVCRFLTAAATGPAAGSATLTYSCSRGTAAAFTFAVAAATNVACAACSGFPIAMGPILATSIGTGEGLSSGGNRTLSIRAPLTRADDATRDFDRDTIIVTVSP